jgi:diamine N-acetyltransferase
LDVKLIEVVRDNFNDVIELKVKKTQEKYLPSNLFSIAESRFSTSTYLRAICVGDKVVGFLDYEFGEVGEPDENECTIWRFMIDQKHQNTGIGKIAMGLLLEEIKAHEHCKLVDVYFDPQNIAAKKLYASYGFKQNGNRDDGDVIAELIL